MSAEMATREDLKPFLVHNAPGWNSRTKTGAKGFSNLAHANLAAATLRSVDFAGAFLQGIDLSGADLTRADLRGANLQCANLIGANLSGANLEGSYLVGADLSNAELSEARLARVNAREANFDSARINGAMAHACVFTSANMANIMAQNINLMHSDLSDTDLRHADLSNACMAASNARNARLQGSIGVMTKARECCFDNVNLIDAQWPNSDMCGSSFQHSVLIGANLSHSNLSNTDFTAANLGKTNLSYTVFQQSIMDGVALWASVRTQWSINGVRCRYAYWDKDRHDPVIYEHNAFAASTEAIPTVDLIFSVSLVDLSKRIETLKDAMKTWLPSVNLSIRGIKWLDQYKSIVTVAILDDGGRHPLDLSSDLLSRASKWLP